MSDTIKTIEKQATPAPVTAAETTPTPAPEPVIPPVATIVNTSRAERLKGFKPKPKDKPIRRAPPEPEKPLNPDLNPSDVRLHVDIRLETRTKVIHARTGKEQSHKYNITNGLTLINSANEINHLMGKISEALNKDFTDYFAAIHPEYSAEAKTTPLLVASRPRNFTEVETQIINDVN